MYALKEEDNFKLIWPIHTSELSSVLKELIYDVRFLEKDIKKNELTTRFKKELHEIHNLIQTCSEKILELEDEDNEFYRVIETDAEFFVTELSYKIKDLREKSLYENNIIYF